MPKASNRHRAVRCTITTLGLLLGAAAPAWAEGDGGFLGRIHHFTTLGSTVPSNGDQNPYAVVVATTSTGKLRKDDVLITNFNDRNNLQGLGTTIVDYTPSTKTWSVFASLPRHLAQCPGGVGLTTAMAVLQSGWVIVGSLPSEDGTTATKGAGCLLIFDSNGGLAGPSPVRTSTDPGATWRCSITAPPRPCSSATRDLASARRARTWFRTPTWCELNWHFPKAGARSSRMKQ